MRVLQIANCYCCLSYCYCYYCCCFYSCAVMRVIKEPQTVICQFECLSLVLNDFRFCQTRRLFWHNYYYEILQPHNRYKTKNNQIGQQCVLAKRDYTSLNAAETVEIQLGDSCKTPKQDKSVREGKIKSEKERRRDRRL